jgi:hypothetical protein
MKEFGTKSCTIPDGLRPGLQACSRRSDPALTRGEMAAVFGKSRRTINRWEGLHGISPVRENARVLRYELGYVVSLVALGRELNTEEAVRLGLNVAAILALASSVALRPNSARNKSAVQPVVLVAADDDDRRLLEAWSDAILGRVLRKIVWALTEEPVITIS